MATIVVGHDGSASGDSALDVAVEIAAGLGDSVAIVFGYAPPGVWGGEIADHEEAIAEHGARVVAAAAKRAEGSGVAIETELVAKKASEALLAVAAERDARMIVVGSYGEAPLKGAILGSTPNKLTHVADRPVLVVPGGSG